MPRPARAAPDAVATIDFAPHKYGWALGADCGRVREVPNYITAPRAHRLRFHELVLVRAGRGSVDIDGRSVALRRRRVILTSAGQVRCWRLDAMLDGMVVCFQPSLFDVFFADTGFVDRLRLFAPQAGCPAIDLSPPDWRRVEATARAMCEELRTPRADSEHMLRALLYRLLIELARAHQPATAAAVAPGRGALQGRFDALVERHFRRVHRVEDYARLLGVTSARLRSATAGAAARQVQQRRLLEARRLLLYGHDGIGRIADRLGFRDASYFSRFFKRLAGTTPLAFRRSFAKHQEIDAK